MDNITQAELNSIKEYKFALLPARIEKAEEKQIETEDEKPRKFNVQCQICGRIFMMNMGEMERHKASHNEEQ